MKTVWRIIALLGGLALFGWYLTRADLTTVWAALAGLGWLAPVALAPYFCVYVVDCAAWRFTLLNRSTISFWTLFRIRWAGEAVNNVLPSAYVGGEAVKVYLLKKRGVCGNAAATSSVVSKTAQTTAQVFYVLLAAGAFACLGGDQPGLRAGMVVVLAAGAAVVWGLFWLQRRGIFSSLLAVTRFLRLDIAALEKRRESILVVDQTIRGFYRHHRWRFLASTGTYFGGWLLDTMEIYVVAHLVGMPIEWSQALAVEAFTSVAKLFGMWIPGSLGVQESGIVMLGRLAGLPDTLAVAYALLRRARELLFALAGWLLLYAEELNWTALRARAGAGLENSSPE